MRRALQTLLTLLVLWAPVLAEEAGGKQQVRLAAQTFGQALQKADASVLRSILPRRGKVQLHLVRLGPDAGFFSSSQVEALFQGFLKQGSVRAFDLVRLEHEEGCYAVAHTRLQGTDRLGRVARIEVHLAFQPEDGRWVLREIRETPP